jgi:hypothetical protein
MMILNALMTAPAVLARLSGACLVQHSADTLDWWIELGIET